MLFPTDGDRIVLTRAGRDGRTRSWIGTVSEVTPYERGSSGLWIGGWRLQGRNMATGEDFDSHLACTEALERYDTGIRQTVRMATAADET
ncbi:hypothetical protein ACIBUR_38725 [Streptomyces anulatus]